MPEEEKKTVDIDTSGPEVEVELPEIKEDKNETIENNTESTDSAEKPSEQPAVQASEEKKEPEQKKELEEYSEGVKRRIAKLTKKMREAERREEAATFYARGVLEEQEKLKSRLAKLDTGYVSEMEGRVKSSMEAAVAKLAKAREENNLKDEVSAQAEISRLGYEEARLNDLKSKKAVEEKPVEQQAEEVNQQIPRRVDPKAQEWAEKNTWFNKDLVMTEGAKAIHRQLVEEEGYDPVNQSEEYYSEIDKRIALEFPHKFVKKDEETTKPTQTVASATRSSRSGRKTQRLTPSEVAIAKKLGVPLDKYAEQKAKLTTKEA
tara:strand:+ start:726 stop:1685 length:960 start_codon:yes stop_codon:yes gene_type:complete